MAASPPPDEFLRLTEQAGIAFDPGDVDRLAAHLDRLDETNRKFNLTAAMDGDTMWVRHVYDSLTLLAFLVSAEAERVIDVGSGGGLPGIPLAVVMPNVHFTLVESTGKKAKFLEETVAALGLTNVSVLNDRAETLAHQRDHREQYDAAIARAVGKLPILLELTVPFLAVGGHVFAIKGERAETEITHSSDAARILHCRIVDTHRTETGTIIVVEKPRRSPKIYPRRPGEPNRAPLGGMAVKHALTERSDDDQASSP